MNVYLRRSPGHLVYHAAALVGVLTLLLVVILFPLLPSSLHVREGDIASQTIRAPHEFSYNSDVARRQLQDDAVRSVPESFSYDVNVKNDQLAKLSDIAGRISSARTDPNLSRQQLTEALNSKGVPLTLDQRSAIAAFSADEWRQVTDEAARLLGSVLEEPFATNELPGRLASLPNRVSLGLTSVQGDVAVALSRPLIVPTERVDTAATQRNRDQATAAVPPQQRSFARDQVIVRDGDVIDAAKREALQNAGLLTARLRYNDLEAVVLLALVVGTTLAAYLLLLHPEVLRGWQRSLLMAVIVAGIVLLAKIYMPLVLPDTRRQFFQFAFPAAAVPMLVASLFDAGLAVAITGLSALLLTFTAIYLPNLSGVVGLTALQPLEMTAAFFFSGLAGLLVVNRADRFNRFLAAGVAVAFATAAVLLSFWLLEPSRHPADLGWLLLSSSLNGLLSSLLTVGTFVLLGSVFNISTRVQLMELAQLNQPLLRRLQEEAPGTFHHSILVGNLGERAADLIGADSLLVRVGCYYHDIGKLSRPGYFIENQLGGDNPHDELDPLASSRIVQEHVRHGLELARKHRLPEQVRAFTVEHHGSRLVAYFYRKAAEEDPDIDPGLFTYPGPRPQSKETAIAMLADSTEAIVRASRDHSPDAIDRLVEGVVAERLTESQFDDSDLTLRDLRRIADSFKATLRAIYHPRIEYPEPSPAERARQQRASGRVMPRPADGAVPAVPAAATAVARPAAPASDEKWLADPPEAPLETKQMVAASAGPESERSKGCAEQAATPQAGPATAAFGDDSDHEDSESGDESSGPNRAAAAPTAAAAGKVESGY